MLKESSHVFMLYFSQTNVTHTVQTQKVTHKHPTESHDLFCLDENTNISSH